MSVMVLHRVSHGVSVSIYSNTPVLKSVKTNGGIEVETILTQTSGVEWERLLHGV